MNIVSNPGPIIGLAKIGRLHLLKALAEEVRIPPFVHRELFGKTGTETREIEKALNDFIRVIAVSVSETSEVAVLNDLDEGERQAVELASAMGKDVLLLWTITREGGQLENWAFLLLAF